MAHDHDSLSYIYSHGAVRRALKQGGRGPKLLHTLQGRRGRHDAKEMAVNKAIAAVEEGMAESFVQTSEAQLLRKLDDDRSRSFAIMIEMDNEIDKLR